MCRHPVGVDGSHLAVVSKEPLGPPQVNIAKEISGLDKLK
jgi:hypothetical protein